MRTVKVAAVISTLALTAACSSEPTGDGGGTACEVDGIYSVTSTQTGGSCRPAGPTTSDVSVSKDSATEATVFLPGVTRGCPAKLDGCKLTANCQLVDAAGTVIATGAVSWTFTADGLQGTESVGFRTPTACTGSYRDQGTRK